MEIAWRWKKRRGGGREMRDRRKDLEHRYSKLRGNFWGNFDSGSVTGKASAPSVFSNGFRQASRCSWVHNGESTTEARKGGSIGRKCAEMR